MWKKSRKYRLKKGLKFLTRFRKLLRRLFKSK